MSLSSAQVDAVGAIHFPVSRLEQKRRDDMRALKKENKALKALVLFLASRLPEEDKARAYKLFEQRGGTL